jgi:predicted O-methyltransferase YrrM
MNSLNDDKVAGVLRRLHRGAGADTFVFLRALPAVAIGMVAGKSAVQSALPYLKDAYIPIDEAQGRALYQFARAIGAHRIVEFGASFGISTLYLAAAVRDNGGGTVTTTEMEPKKIARARENYRAAGFDREITLLEGDALETLKSVDGPVDLVFLDGWKELCLPVLQLLEPKLRPGAAIFCDDMKAFRRTLKPYVDYVRAPAGKYSSLELPLGDGLEFSVALAD